MSFGYTFRWQRYITLRSHSPYRTWLQSLLTVLSLKLATQMFAPSKATPY